MLLISGCLKKAATYTDFSSLQDFVVLTGGAGGSSSVNVAFNRGADLSQVITADLASTNNNSGAVTVTIAVDPAALTAYNTANGTNYVALPTANYKLQSNTISIPAGQHYGSTTLALTNLGTLDPGTSYMVAISITDASGKKLSTNLNTLYYYSIGNSLAGTYTFLGQRWNSPILDTTKAPASTPYNNITYSPQPLGPTTLFFDETYLAQNLGGGVAGYRLDFTNNNGVLSNFAVSLYGGSALGSFSIIGGPTLVGYKIVGTAATKFVGSTFRFYMAVDNGAGAQRASIDTYTKTQ